MAIQINIPWDTLLIRCGLESAKNGEFIINKTKCSIKYRGIHWWVMSEDFTNINTWLVEGHFGDLNIIKAEALKAKIKTKVKAIITKGDKDDEPVENEAPYDALQALVGGSSAPDEEVADIDAIIDLSDEVASASAEKVTLLEATKLLQPIYGTSQGSTYHAIGIGSKFNVATRIKGKGPYDLALRIEGKGADMQEIAKTLNMTLNSKGHVSLHLGLPKTSDVSKVVGAILFTLSSQLDHVASIAQVTYLFDKGV